MGQQCPIVFCDIEGKEDRGKTCLINTDAYIVIAIATICYNVCIHILHTCMGTCLPKYTHAYIDSYTHMHGV